MFREREHERSRAEHMWQGSRVILRIWLQLRKGYVAGCIDEAEKIAIGDRGAVDPEPVDLHPVRRRLFRIVVVGSHMERVAGNPNHPVGASLRDNRSFGRLRRIRTSANGV